MMWETEARETVIVLPLLTVVYDASEVIVIVVSLSGVEFYIVISCFID